MQRPHNPDQRHASVSMDLPATDLELGCVPRHSRCPSLQKRFPGT